MTIRRASALTSPLPVSLPVIAAAILAVLIAWIVVRLLWLVISGPQVPPAAALTLPTQQHAARVQHGSLQDLFGQTNRPTQRPQTPAVESLEGWRLQGVLRSGQHTLAILSDPAGEAQVYRIDQALDDERRLTQIDVNEVVIEQRGRAHRLALHEAMSEETDATMLIHTRDDALAGQSWDGHSFEGVGVASLGAAADQWSGPAQALIVALPVRGGGVRVRPGRDASVFTQIGLQTNDVVTAINGQAIDDDIDWLALLMREEAISITLQRQGRQMVLTPDREALIRSLQSL
jgi:general secretion pathway protein C